MDSIYFDLQGKLVQMGLTSAQAQWILPIVTILTIVLLAYLLIKLCRRIMIPAVKRLTAKTAVKWDDYLFNDEVLNNFSIRLPSISVLIPNPIIRQPEQKPFLSGNQEVTVETTTLYEIPIPVPESKA